VKDDRLAEVAIVTDDVIVIDGDQPLRGGISRSCRSISMRWRERVSCTRVASPTPRRAGVGTGAPLECCDRSCERRLEEVAFL
jgi:hypothetical protein